MDRFFIEPRSDLWPGDVFMDVPFPLLKYPVRTYRPDAKAAQKQGKVQVFESDGTFKQGDIAHCTYKPERVMLLSHGCEIDNVLRSNSADRRHWLAAPIEPLSGKQPEMQERIRGGQQPNRFYLPSDPLFEKEETCVDLRRILPLPAQLIVESKRVVGLSEVAVADLHSQLGVFFSGLALYVQQIECPVCATPINPASFKVASGGDDEDTYAG
jgi:hypothetical protein